MSAGRFQPGRSGNPGGRPKSISLLAKLIRSSTRDGAELVEDALKVLRDPGATRKDKNIARAWLGDRGFGRALQVVELGDGATIEGTLDLSKCTPDQLDALAALPIEGEEESMELEAVLAARRED